MQLNLNGAWQFRKRGEGEWKAATVPGCNYLDLLNLGEIPDPFVGTNEKEVLWVAKSDWEYKKVFEVSEVFFAYDRILLDCKMLDTLCEVYLNDVCVGKGENAHLRYQFDVKAYLKVGENTLRIVFYSPVNYIAKQQKIDACPRNGNGLDGIPHIRKPQCHFGWDWGPVLPPSGISGDIALVGQSAAAIQDYRILQHHGDNQVELEISVTKEQLSDTPVTYVLKVLSPQGERIAELQGDFGDGEAVSQTVTIENPELWWTRDLSDRAEQPLYTVCIELVANREPVDSVTQKIGLRTIELNRESDQYGQNFQFRINGVPLFIKGANRIPADSFINRCTEERLEYDLDAVKFSNMNMLRIWGGGYYESDLLYEKCDRDGILVWQDFCFACQPYPFYREELLQNVQKEVEYNVKRLRHHASLALWNGNNEIETMSIAWRNRLKLMEWTEKFFYHILPEWLQALDAVTPYIPGSPCGVDYMKGFDRDNVGDTHLWAVWHGLQPLTYYRKRMTRFCSEFGFESLPDLKTIEQYAKPSDYSLTSEVFTAHQKCSSGNMKMAYYITSRFRLPKHFEDYIYLSQICQEECVRDATEHWRRNRGRCNGSMYWQLNDCWPVCSWASMDYYGNYKALQYSARHFNAPVTVSVEDTKDSIRIFVLNDTRKPIESCCVRYKLLGFDGIVHTAGECSSVTIEPCSAKCLEELPLEKLKKHANLQQCVLVTELLENGKTISRRTVLFAPEKDLQLPKTDIQTKVEVKDGKAILTLHTEKYLRFVQVHSKHNTKPFSDNYFDLMPGETKVITQPVGEAATAAEIEKGISYFSAGDVVPNASRLSDAFTKAKIFLQPINFGNYIYYCRMSNDLKLK